MNEIPEERKLQLLRYIEREYFKQPERSWWQAKNPVYTTTQDYAKRCSGRKIETEELEIRYSRKKAVHRTAFLFIILAYPFLPDVIHGMLWKNVNPLYCIISILILSPYFSKAINRKSQITITTEGLWLHNKNVYIYWKYWVASFIKAYDDGENTYHSLVIHHYDPLHNEFTETEYKLNDDLEVSNEELAYYIEQWKR